MLWEFLKKRLDKELSKVELFISKRYELVKIPYLYANIKEFILRKGKRLRPLLFLMGYRGFEDSTPSNLYRTALAFELLHDFFLIHDDIIDKSDIRRGGPSMHRKLEQAFAFCKDRDILGQDLAIVTGDIIFTLAIELFLSIKVNPINKQRALHKFIEAAFYTGCGEFIEIIYGKKDIERIDKRDIYKVYDYKTSYYSFIAPLVTGAILAGASLREINILSHYGISLGRAFQIKDDILGIFGEEKKIGKSIFTDLEEAKKTILIWYAYNKGNKRIKKRIKTILNKKNINNKILEEARDIIHQTGSLNYAKKEIKRLQNQSLKTISLSGIKNSIKKELILWSEELLKI